MSYKIPKDFYLGILDDGFCFSEQGGTLGNPIGGPLDLFYGMTTPEFETPEFRKNIFSGVYIGMKTYGKKRGARRVRKVVKRIIRKRSQPSKAFAKKVQKVISKNVETKTALYVSPDTNTLTYPFGSRFNQAVNGNADAIRILPDFINGPAENQRVGNEIRMQSLVLRGVMTVSIPQATANNTRLGVRLLILRNKRINDYISATTDMGTNFGRLLEQPQGPLNGTLAAFNTPVNHDYFSCVYDKKFYFSQSLSSTATNSQEVFNSTKFVNISIPYSRRKVLFDEGFDVDTPINYPYFAVLSYTKLSGDSVDGDGATYVNFQFTTLAKYEDA